jgi:hypothetical protein
VLVKIVVDLMRFIAMNKIFCVINHAGEVRFWFELVVKWYIYIYIYILLVSVKINYARKLMM